MSTETVDAAAAGERAEPWHHVALRVAFGDRRGLFVFLASVAAFMLAWRVGFTISDNYTLANGLAALADGHLHVTEPVYAGSLDTPGMHSVDGRAYPRNFGQLFFALPFVWAFRALATVAHLRVGLTALWCLLVLGTFVLAGREFGRPRLVNVAGVAVAGGAFASSFLWVEPLAADRLDYLALQTSNIVLAALTCVLLCWLAVGLYDRRVGLAAGLSGALASPLLLWASVPKRHVPMGALVVASLYLLYRSRAADAPTSSTRFRALAYVPVGLAAWVHSAEGLVLFTALLVADLATARSNDPRSLATVAGALAVSLVPFLLTNLAVVGSPVEPPRMWPAYGADSPVAEPGTSASGAGDGGAGDGGVPILAPVAPLLGLLSKALFFVHLLVDGTIEVVARPLDLYRAYVHLGFVEGGPNLAIDLAYVESLPIVGAVAGAVLAAPGRAVNGFRQRWRDDDPTAALDLFVVVYAVLLTLVYLPRLPVHTQFTIRYLFPLFPLGVYALARVRAVRQVVHERPRLLAGTYVAGVLLGAQLLFAAVVLVGAPVDVATQGFGLASLALAGAVAVWSGVSTRSRPSPGAGAVLLGLAAAALADFVVVLSVYYFQSDAVLPFVPTV